MSKKTQNHLKNVSICKVDLSFKVTYGNSKFLEEIGCNLSEIIGEPVYMLRHPKMPTAIYERLYNKLQKGKDYNLISREITKSGECFWFVNNVTIDRDSEEKPMGYTTVRKFLPKSIIERIKGLYNDLSYIKNQVGPIAAEFYLNGYLAGIGKSYEDYIITLFNDEISEDKIEKSISKKTLDWFFQSEYIE